MVLPDDIKKDLEKIFSETLKKEVDIVLITDHNRNHDSSHHAEELAKDLEEINEKIRFEIVDANDEKGMKYLEDLKLKLDKWGNRFGPIYFFKDKPNIVYYGIPYGEEFPVFIEDIKLISTGNLEMSLKIATKVKKINLPLDLYIFVTPSCPYCPYMTFYSHRFAYLNDKIRGIMIEALEFPEFADAYHVHGVPKNVIRDREKDKDLLEWEGMVPEATFLEAIEEAIQNV